MALFSFLNRYFRVGDIRLHPEKRLGEEELNHVLVSCLDASQHFAYLNAYETGLSQKEIKHFVHSAWRINDREEALEALNKMISDCQDQTRNTAYEIAMKANYEEEIEARFPNDNLAQLQYKERCVNLQKVIPLLLKKGIVKDNQELLKIKDTAWILGRGAFLARCCFDLGYFTKPVIQSILIGFYRELKKSCSTWEEYTKSYIVGRNLAGLTHSDNLLYLSQKLLNHKKSPLYGKVEI